MIERKSGAWLNFHRQTLNRIGLLFFGMSSKQDNPPTGSKLAGLTNYHQQTLVREENLVLFSYVGYPSVSVIPLGRMEWL